jgi:hypothetical protein
VPTTPNGTGGGHCVLYNLKWTTFVHDTEVASVVESVDVIKDITQSLEAGLTRVTKHGKKLACILEPISVNLKAK